ncbi:MAG TPA: PIN domain-containing protein [Thermoanaerobaculia bacterium]
MVIVDTSIWISLYRKKSAEIGHLLWMLTARNEAAVTGQIWVEFLGGFRDRATRTSYSEKLRAFPFVETGRDAYDLAAELLAAHPRLGAGDAIIAATAITSGAALWTADADFNDLRADGLTLFA